MFLATLFSFFSSTDYADADFKTLRDGCVKGREPARRALIARYEAVAWRAVRARMGWASQEVQAEVIADPVIALLKDDGALLMRYDPLKGLSPEGWVRRQAQLQANNKARSLSTRKRRSEVLASTVDEAAAEHRHPGDDPNPEEALMDAQDLQGLMVALQDSLSPAIALTFQLLYVRELAPSAAAAAMGCSMDTLYTRKRRLVATVRALVEARNAGGPT